MECFVLKDKQYFVINSWMEQFPDLIAGFTSKNGGVSEGFFSSLNVGFHVKDYDKSVQKNREIIAEVINFPLNKWVGAEQTHETYIKEIFHTDIGRGASDYKSSFLRTDGFFTFDKGVLLTLCFADCVPLYFIHPKTKAIGIVHAGWKGTVNRIAEEMINLFKKYQIDEKEILAVIGPSICKECYIVDDYVINQVNEKLKYLDDKPYKLVKQNQYKLDLKSLNKEILIKAGILRNNILLTNLCTSCNNEFFYSHRRDNGNTGRMISFIGWKESIFKNNENRR